MELLKINDEGWRIVITFNPERFSIADMRRFSESTSSINWKHDPIFRWNEVGFVSCSKEQRKEIHEYVAEYNKEVKE